MPLLLSSKTNHSSTGSSSTRFSTTGAKGSRFSLSLSSSANRSSCSLSSACLSSCPPPSTCCSCYSSPATSPLKLCAPSRPTSAQSSSASTSVSWTDRSSDTHAHEIYPSPPVSDADRMVFSPTLEIVLSAASRKAFFFAPFSSLSALFSSLSSPLLSSSPTQARFPSPFRTASSSRPSRSSEAIAHRVLSFSQLCSWRVFYPSLKVCSDNSV